MQNSYAPLQPGDQHLGETEKPREGSGAQFTFFKLLLV